VALFQHFGTSPAGACRPATAFTLSEVFLSGSRWTTDRGLRLGDSLADLQRLYPQAANPADCVADQQTEGAWWRLDRTPNELGGPGSYICTLSAIVQSGIVTQFELSSYAASE
jgi:hypothetical protein